MLIAYLQLPPTEFRLVLARSVRAVAPDGTLFMSGHALRNLSAGIGGPRQADVLWEAEDIRQRLRAAGLTVRRAEEVLRPVEAPDGVRAAIDTLVLAERHSDGYVAEPGSTVDSGAP